jgi:thymidylate synthase (FAD)
MPPTVRLVSTTNLDMEQIDAFLRENNTSWARTERASQEEEIIEAAGRICYMSFGDKQSPRQNSEYLRHLISQGHESVLEHVSWGFLITGVSRAFTHQLVRHRVGFAFSQLSQQYHEETDAHFVEPQVELPPSARAAWEKATKAAKEAYNEILDSLRPLEKQPARSDASLKEIRRAVRSTARSVLPNATETKIWVTANARALRHFFSVRGTLAGDLEMRQVATETLRLVKKNAPSLFFDFDVETMSDGTPIVVKNRSLTIELPEQEHASGRKPY